MKSNTEPGAITVLHREYIRDIFPTAAFNVTAFPINPGLSQTFPWLSQVADAYESYKLKGLVFEFKTRSSDSYNGASTPSLGSVIMATDYNANNTTFGSKVEMENYQFATSQPPTKSFLHAVELSRSQSPLSTLYLRQGLPTEARYDPRFYDFGNFQIATSGNQVAGANPLPCGELWVTYEVELFKPKFRTSAAKLDHYLIMHSNSLSSNFYANQTQVNPITNVPLLNANTPQANSFTKSNGIFKIGTYITTDANNNIINFPYSSTGKSYMVYIVEGQAQVGPLYDGTNRVANIIPESFVNCAVFKTFGLARDNGGRAVSYLNGTAEFVRCTATANENLENTHSSFGITIGALGPADVAQIKLKLSQNVISQAFVGDEDGTIDIFVIEVDPASFIIPV